MPEYSLLVFDWDGTLVDSIQRIVESMRAAADACDLAQLPEQTIRDIIGLGLPEAIATLYPALEPGERFERFRRVYSEHYIGLEQSPSPFFPGAREALEGFRQQGYRLAVATGKSRRGLDRVLRGHDLLEFFDVTRCADETASKPHPLMLEEILAVTASTPQQALMVGDSPFDLDMAHAASMTAVAVGHGAQSLEVLRRCRPHLEINHFSELVCWLGSDVH